jgi:two-component system C4-dicarboxylate transport response regulator DctD
VHDVSDPVTGARVILFEDDIDLRHALSQSLQLEGFTVDAYESFEAYAGRFTPSFAGVVISDIRLPGHDGRQIFRTLQHIDTEIPVILITGHGELQEAVDLMREGVYDFISKPFAPSRLLASVRNALEFRELVLDNRAIRQRSRIDDVPLPLLGESERIANLRSIVRDLASTDVSVLLVGETGTGKESVAKMLHRLSNRQTRSFSVLDCASLPDALLEAELFGTEESVAGMRRHRAGKIEAANQGTLFLDSIDCLPVAAQGRLLRVVEEKRVTALGASSSRDVSCRVISAATQDLGKMCAEGLFRADLYFRLNTVTLNLPPLRERREDIATLFIELLARAAQRLKRPSPTLTKAVKSRLLEYAWPGNIRELSHYADRVVLGLEQRPNGSVDAAVEPLPELVERFEASVIKEALRASAGSVKACLEILQIPRKTFYDKVARYAIDLETFRGRAGK